MSEKMFNTRIQHKHDIEANWLKATNFVPKAGELIVYDVDENYSYTRAKIGDGVSNINNLPFSHQAAVIASTEAPEDTTAVWVDLDDDTSGEFEGAVLYTAQTLTDEQKAQARTNIGAAEGGVQPDWNQNDSTAADFIKNKPFSIIDSSLSSTSTNPVQNKVIRAELRAKQNILTFDSTPRSGGTNPVTSGGLYTKFDEQNKRIVNSILSAALTVPGSLKWDGVIGDKEYVNLGIGGSGEYLVAFVHVSDEYPEVLTPGRTVSALAGITMLGEGVQTEQASAIVADDGFVELIALGVAIVPADNYTIEGITFPKKGIYFYTDNILPMGIDISLMYTYGLSILGHVFKDNSMGDYFETVTTTTNLGDTLTWDGDKTGRIVVSTTFGSLTIEAVKISDNIPTKDDFIQGVLCIGSNGASTNLSASEIANRFNEDGKCDGSGFVIIPVNNYVDPSSDLEMMYPEAGIYFAYQKSPNFTGYTASIQAPGYNFTTLKTETIIKTEHLPKALRFGEITKTVGGDTLTWDGNTDGLVNGGGIYYRVSDAVPTLNDIHQGFSLVIHYYDGRDPEELVYSAEQATEMITINDDGVIFYDAFGIFTTSVIEGDVTYPSGVYLISNDMGYVSSLTINGYNGFISTSTELVKIDPKYLPDGVGGGTGSGLPDASISTNGAFLRVVDGVWAAVTLPNAEEGEF